MNKQILLTGLFLTASGCSLEIDDLNNPSRRALQENPTSSLVNAAAVGMVVGNRVDIADQAGYVSVLGIIGRESYVFDPADPRFVSVLLESEELPGDGRFGGGFWSAPYRNIQTGNLTLGALEKVAMPDEEKAGIGGFVKTMQALDLLVVINTHYDSGAVVETTREFGEELPPIENRDVAYNRIAELLDEAHANLLEGGSAFSFKLPTGFEGFDSPADFATFNRGVRARVAAYQEDWSTALDALENSFVSTSASLDLGVFHNYALGQGDVQNGLVTPNLFAHPSILADVELKADGEPDDRYTKKVREVETGGAQAGLSSNLKFNIYPSPTSPVSVLRNEELVLLRAEANIGLGNLDAAIEDINFIRETSGGLAPRTDITADNAVDELLAQRRYSLLFEYGHRWIDMRRYGKLGELPRDLENHFVLESFSIPLNEQNARGL